MRVIRSDKSWRGFRPVILCYMLIYFACVISAGMLWQRPNSLFFLYLAIVSALIWRWHSRSDLFYFFVSFLLGPLGEIFAVKLGAWQYSGSRFILPLWLPFAWGITMLFLKKTAEVLLEPPLPATEQPRPSLPAIQEPRSSLLEHLLMERARQETDLLRSILQAFALYLAITGGLLKFSLDVSATPSVRLALIILGMGLSGIGLVACILAVYHAINMEKGAAELALSLGLMKNPVGFTMVKSLALLISVFVLIVLVGWSYIWLAGWGVSKV